MEGVSELTFVDDDIAAYFKAAYVNELYYKSGLPTQVQLARYVKKLYEQLERYNDKQ